MVALSSTICAAIAVIIFAAKESYAVLTIHSTGNPILADGSYYSADPGPIVVNDTLYIVSGQDSAPLNQNNFIMNDWFLFEATDPDPAGNEWTVYTDFLSPHSLFDWAATGSAYASQIVQGPDGRFYLYSPVSLENTTNQDPFAIGVAVADDIHGPWTDHHPSGPIVSQSYPAPGNTIENIDPTVLVDDDSKVYMYWGTFGALKGVQLGSDMTTFVSDIVDVTTLDGFFEASWLMKRNGVYYILYADNSVGSECTPTVYHACIAYGTSDSPLGPWTYRGVILGIVSSTTSHPGAVKVKDQWYLVYHTADAKDGGNFRRSLAFDKMDFDDTTSPPSILPVKQTHRPASQPPPTRNRAQLASATSNPIPAPQYWIEAIHDQKVPVNPLPPEYWSSYNGDNNQQDCTLTYSWNSTVSLNQTSMVFFADQPAGSGIGVAPPASWYVEYLTSSGAWAKVNNDSSYPVAVTDTPSSVGFNVVKTKGLRAVLKASSDGTSVAGIGVKEWWALATTFI